MSPLTDDRTVFATNGRTAVVRYDRAGKWYVESQSDDSRQKVTLRNAARAALDIYADGGVIYHGRPGGNAFYRKLAEL